MLYLIKFLTILINIALIAIAILTKHYNVIVYLGIFLLYFLFIFQQSIENKRLGFFSKRAMLSSNIVLLLFLLAFCRLIQIQIINKDAYGDKIRRQSEAFIIIKGARGEIIDNNNKSLSYNTTNYEVAMDPSRIYDKDEFIDALSEILDLDFIKTDKKEFITSLDEYYKTKRKYRLIAKDLSDEEKEKISVIINKYGIGKNEIFFKANPKRVYYKNDVYNSLVGFIDFESKNGVFGIEKRYDNYLTGKDIKKEMRVDRDRKRVIPTLDNNQMQRMTNGKNVHLTIDSDIHIILNEELKKKFLDTKAEAAFGIVMDPNDGEVLGTASFYSGKRALRNGVFQDQVEPGSIFKPLIMGAALNEKLFTRDTKFNIGHGTTERYGHTIKETTKSLQGVITAEDIIRRSSNTGMVQVGDKFSNELFENYLKRYGLYNRTGIDFSNEIKPYTAPSKKWDMLKKSTMSFGQGIAISPIQMITAFSAVINGGKLFKPYLVERIEDENGVVVMRNIPTVVNQVLTQETSDIMKDILHNAVESGTGVRAKVPDIPIGGKTGTGQIAGVHGTYLKDDYLASFIGFFPVDKPKYVILIMIVKPKGATINEKYGGSVAAPVFSEIVKRIIKIKSIWSENKNDVREIKSGIKISDPLNVGSSNVKLKEISGEMPDLIGLSPKDVVNLFYDTGIEVEVEGKGLVERQIPEPGTDLKTVSKIRIILK